MSWFGNIFRSGVRASTPTPEVPRNPNDPRWWPGYRRMPAAGVPVNLVTALTVPTVFDCTQVVQQSVGSLPWAMFERLRDGSKRRRDTHPLSAVFRAPNPETTDVEFFGQLAFDLATDGNFYAEIGAGRLGPITTLTRISPSLVMPERGPEGQKRYRVTDANGRQRVLFDDTVWHVKKMPTTADGLRGVSTISLAAEVISASLALQEYGARFFANDATPPIIVKLPGQFKDDVSRKSYLQAIKEWATGENRHNPAVLEYGADIVKVGTTNEEAQFLETRKELALELTRYWRMPPHKVGLLDRATNNNIEHQALEFVSDTLIPYLRLIERSISSNLVLRDEVYFFEFNVAGLLRGDLKSRYEAYSRGRQWGWLSVNDIRRLENMNGIPEGDIYLTPMNMQTAGSEDDGADRKAKKIYGPSGEVVSRIVDGNIVRLADYREMRHESDRDAA